MNSRNSAGEARTGKGEKMGTDLGPERLGGSDKGEQNSWRRNSHVQRHEVQVSSVIDCVQPKETDPQDLAL